MISPIFCPARSVRDTVIGPTIDHAAQDNKRLSVIYADLNRCKQVNDQFGHKAGDCYLKLISQRFLAQIRSCDTVARIGGDEFLLIVPLSAGVESTEEIVARLRSCFDSPFHVDEVRLVGSASFGSAIYPDDGLTADDLKRNADYAMYLAKKAESETVQGTEKQAAITASEMQPALQLN